MVKHWLRLMVRTFSGEIRQPSLFPPGHFYSPIADLRDIRGRADKIWIKTRELPGIDWREERQLALLNEIAGYIPDIDFPVSKPDDPARYYYENDQFPVLDAEFLHALIAHTKPKRFVEVGSGFSSLITAEANRKLFGSSIEVTCIEPYPRQFLIDGIPGISRLLVKKVEDVDLSLFSELASGDILFIDSSHVSKVGSDVNHLFFEVIPRLKPGVLIHIHDIFLPNEYPRQWVIEQGRHWNEQYLVRAFLQFNRSFEIVWAAAYMIEFHSERLKEIFQRFPKLGGGGSLWLRRTDGL